MLSFEQKQTAQKKLIATCKFWGVALPLFLLWFVPPYVKSFCEVPIYRNDCGATAAFSGAASSTLPCYYQAATATLENHFDSRGRHNGQDVLLVFPNGKIATMEIDGDPGIWKTAAQVNGVCFVEYWHGAITAIVKSGAKTESHDNPEIRGDVTGGFLLLFLSTMTVGMWLFLWLQRRKRVQ